MLFKPCKICTRLFFSGSREVILESSNLFYRLIAKVKRVDNQRKSAAMDIQRPYIGERVRELIKECLNLVTTTSSTPITQPNGFEIYLPYIIVCPKQTRSNKLRETLTSK